MNRYLRALCGSALLLCTVAVVAQITLVDGHWDRVEIDGQQVCVRSTGEQIPTDYLSPSYAGSRCNSFNIFEAWLQTAEALPLGTIQICSDGRGYTSDPTCASAGGGVDLAATGTIPNFSGLVEDVDTISHDFSQYFTCTNCATVTYSLETVSGSSCVSGMNNWTITASTGVAANTGMDSVSGTCRVRASDSGGTSVLGPNSFSWAFSTPGTETDPPPQGDWWDSPVGGSGTVTLSMLLPPDYGGSGVEDIQLSADDSVVATITAGVGAGLAQSYTEGEVGTVAGTPVYTDPDTESPSITCQGTGFDTAGAHSFCYSYRTVSGDFYSVIQIDSVSSGNSSFDQHGIVYNANGVDDGSPFVSWYYQGNDKCQAKYSDVQDGGRTVLGTFDCTLPVRLVLRRVSDLWTFGHKHPTTDDFYNFPLTDRAISVGTQGNAGAFVTANDGSMDITGNFSNFYVNNEAIVTYERSTMVAEDYDFVVRDLETTPNASVASVTITGTPGAPPTSGDHKWFPGDYIRFPTGDSQTTILNTRVPELCAMANVKGALYKRDWSQVETGEGVYNLTSTRQITDALAACNKRLILEIRAQDPNCNASPAYLMDAAYEGGVSQQINPAGGFYRCNPLWWKAVVMDRFILLMAAIAAEFETDPNFEMVNSSETAHGQPANVANNTVHWPSGYQSGLTVDYSPPAYVTQLKRLIDAAKGTNPLFPTTGFGMFINFISQASTSDTEDLISHLEQTGGIHGWPDTFPQGIAPSSCGAGCTNPGTVETRSAGQKIRMGLEGSGTDYRPLMACISSIQPPEMGGGDGNHTPDDLFTELNTNLDCAYAAWTRKTWELNGVDGVDEANWLSGGTLQPNGLKAAINAGYTYDNTTCPANYTAGCEAP